MCAASRSMSPFSSPGLRFLARPPGVRGRGLRGAHLAVAEPNSASAPEARSPRAGRRVWGVSPVVTGAAARCSGAPPWTASRAARPTKGGQVGGEVVHACTGSRPRQFPCQWGSHDNGALVNGGGSPAGGSEGARRASRPSRALGIGRIMRRSRIDDRPPVVRRIARRHLPLRVDRPGDVAAGVLPRRRRSPGQATRRRRGTRPRPPSCSIAGPVRPCRDALGGARHAEAARLPHLGGGVDLVELDGPLSAQRKRSTSLPPAGHRGRGSTGPCAIVVHVDHLALRAVLARGAGQVAAFSRARQGRVGEHEFLVHAPCRRGSSTSGWSGS